MGSDEDDIESMERLFHNAVREYVVLMLLFILLYVSSYFTICAYRRRTEKEEYYSNEAEDAIVYRISLWLCTFTLAASGGTVLLLPLSIVANELLVIYPNSYYFQWVQSSLIHDLWNTLFLLTNLALFILMPFAYLFTESEGLPGSKKGIWPRVYETTLVLSLLGVLVCGLAWVASAILDNDKYGKQALFDVWNFYLPYLYSCISLLGVMMLLLCTPVGFARLFTVIGELVMRPQFLKDIQEELSSVCLEEETLKRKIQYSYISSLANGHSSNQDLQGQLDEIARDRQELERKQQTSSFRRTLGFPLVMLLLLVLTAISVLMVSQNTLELLIGLKALPVGAKELVLGMTSLSALGPVGAAIEITVILYLMLASILGFYTLPLLGCLKPKRSDTPMTKIIGNCIFILIMSSALPVLSRTLGITHFDLLGSFGRIDWLDNFYIILSYNIIFAVATATCLTTKFTVSIRRELISRFFMAFSHVSRRTFSEKSSKHSYGPSSTPSTPVHRNGNGVVKGDESYIATSNLHRNQ